LINRKAVQVHRTPREAEAVYQSDWMQKFNYCLNHPISEEAKIKWFPVGGPLTSALYLARFPRYYASYIRGHDLVVWVTGRDRSR